MPEIKFFQFAAILILIQQSEAQTYTCPTGGWIMQGQYCFRPGASSVTWTTAENTCNSFFSTSHLPYFFNNVSWNSFQTYRSTAGLISTQLWIGCQKTGTYKWSNGNTPFSYSPSGGLPTGTLQYCISDMDASNTWTSTSNGSQTNQYICMMDAIQTIDSTQIYIFQSATSVAAGAQVKFWGQNFTGQDATTVYEWNFGDGSKANTTGYNFNVSHIFVTASNGTPFVVTVKLTNAVSGPYSSLNDSKVNVYKPCSISSCSSTSPVTTGSAVAFTIVLTSGSNCNLTMDPKDGLSAVQVGFGAFDVQNCVPADPLCGPTATQWTSTFSYAYNPANTYIANVSAVNGISNTYKLCTPTVVQDAITGLVVTAPTTPQYYPYNTPVTVNFAITTGTAVKVNGTVDSNNVSLTWSQAGKSGSLTIFPNNMIDVGLKMVKIIASNLVTPMVTVSYDFTVEYPFKSLKYTPANGYISTTNTNPLTLSWSNATVVNCIVDFQGAAAMYTGTNLNQVIVAYNSTLSTNIPTYSTPGSYQIFVNCSNHIGFANYTISVIAQDPICCASLTVDYFGSMATPTSSAPVQLSLIWTDTSKPWPTSAKYDYNFIQTAGTIGNTYLNKTPQVINYTYTVSNCYPVNVTVYNLVSNITFIRSICIVVELGNVTFNMTKLQPPSGNEPHYYYLKTNEVATFSLKLTQGTLFNWTINFDDTKPVYNVFSTTGNQLYYNYSFSQPGNYNVSMFLQQAGQPTVNRILPIPSPYKYLVVQNPVDCYVFTIVEGTEPVITYANRMLGTTIHVNITSNSSCGTTKNQPPNYLIDWGDFTKDNGTLPSTDGFLVPHVYNSSQIFKLNFTIWNDVSSEKSTQSIYVYEEVTQVNITAVWVNDTATNQLLSGYYPTSNQAYFPLGYTMKLFAGMIYGNLETYEWRINNVLQLETNKTLVRNFTTIGSYQIDVQIKNSPTYGHFSFKIIIEKPTKNLNITDNSPWPVSEEPFHQYSISMDSVGTDSCYYLNMDDPTAVPGIPGWQNALGLLGSPDCPYMYFGNLQMCKGLFPQFPTTTSHNSCPSFTAITSANLEAPAVMPNENDTSTLMFGTINMTSFLNFSHQFAVRGAHNVTLIVKNHVFNKTIYYRSVATKGWCHFAVVLVNGLNKCQTTSNCRCYFNADSSCSNADVPYGNRISYFKDNLLVDSDVTMNCSSSANVWFKWNVQKIDTTIPGNILSNATHFLDGIPYATFSSKTLVIPAHAIPADMERSDTTIVVIEPSRLVAQFNGGAVGKHVPQSQEVLFDAWTQSYDPDIDQSDKTGLKFAFYCRRLCEIWPPPLQGQTYGSWGIVLDAGCSPATDGTTKGCFGSGPMQLSGKPTSGKWSVNSGNITLNTLAMSPNVWYSLMVVVTKDTRVSYTEMFFFVSTANVPNITLHCITNCQLGYSKMLIGGGEPSGRTFNRVNPTSRFSVEAIIDGFDMSQTYLFNWDVINRKSYDPQVTSFSMANLEAVPDDEWLPNVTTGRNIRTFSFRSNWFGNATSDKPGFYLRLTFWISSKSSGRTGEYLFEFFLNDPPQGVAGVKGTCFPNHQGVSLGSTFGITCSNFQDSNNGDIYYFVKQIEQTNREFWLDIGSNKLSAMKDGTIYVQAVPGPENSTSPYSTNFKVRVIDSSGSFVDVYVNGSVMPFDYNSTYRDNAVWSILEYTSTCSMCKIENFYLQMTKLQRTVDVAAVVRTFATMLNLNPSSGCLPLICDNKTADAMNCTVGEEIEVTTMAPEPIPTDIVVQIEKSLGTNWKYLTRCQLDLELRIYLREKILDAFSTLKIPYFSSFALMLSALYPATVIPQENTIKIMQYVETVIREGVTHLDGVDPFMTITLDADIREEMCTIITGVVANMERTTNYYGAIWRGQLLKYYPQFTMDGLQVEVALLDTLLTANTSVDYMTFKFNETNPIWRLVSVNDTLDSLVSDDLAKIRFNITLISVVLNRIYSLKSNVTNYVQARKAMGEEPSVLQTTNITAVYHKTPVKNMTNFPMEGLGACQFRSANAAEMFGDLNNLEETLMGSIECAKNNPFTTDTTSEGLTGTVSMSFQNSKGSIDVANLTKPVDIFIPREFDKSILKPIWNTTESFSKPMNVYSFSLPQYLGLSLLLYTGWLDIPENDTFHNSTDLDTSTTHPVTKTTVKVTTGNGSEDDSGSMSGPGAAYNGERFIIFVKFWTTFDLENKYDWSCVVPRWDETVYNSSAYQNPGDPHTCTVSWNQALAAATVQSNTQTKSINVYVAVQSYPKGTTLKDFKNTTRISSFNDYYFVPVNYTLYPIYSTCMYYDSTRRIWRGDGTDIGPNTTIDVTHCQATHLTSFSSGFNVPMNSLNLQDSAFLHLAENPIAFVFCMCLFCLYLILFIWCRRKDKEDLKKTGIAPLPDNDPRDRYLYQIVFYTGSRPNAGTSAQIFFQLTAEQTESEVRLAKDSQRTAFRRNGIDTFIMAVPFALGKLTYLRIWHDNSGDSPSWYLSRFQIMDVQTGEEFFFVVDNWLAVEEGDGHVERIVPVAGKKDLTDFSQLFWQKSQKNLFDGHIWFSVFRRPPRSHFTRVQRLTCCLSLIYCTMVANILFYQVKVAQFDDIILSIGPITVTWTSLKTGIIAALIVAPINTILVLLFRYAKPIPIKSPMEEYLENQKKLEASENSEQKKSLKQKFRKNSPETNPTTGSAEDSGTLIENAESPNETQRTELNEQKHAPFNDDLGSNKGPLVKGSTDELELVETQPNGNLQNDHAKDNQEPPKIVHIDTRVKKKRFWLPHWVIYIGYVLAFVTVGVAFWLIMQIAFGFGKKKALDWVIAMFMSLIESIIFIQPVKIIVMAIVYSVLCKKPEKDEYEPSEIELREDEVYIHEDDLNTLNDMKSKSKRQMILQKLKRTRNALPPQLQLLQNARELKMKEMAMWGLIKEIAFYAIFLYTLMMVAYGERNILTFRMVQNGHDLFVSGSAQRKNSNATDFNSIQKQIDFFDWAEQTLLPALFPTSTYNNKPLPSGDRYVDDGQGYLAGTVRFRQLRVKPNSCNIPTHFKNSIFHCRAPYSVSNEDWGQYKKQWVTLDPNNTDDVPDDLFTWKNMSILKSSPFIGIVTTYWGGGFVADLGYDGESAENIFNQLELSGWLDAHTRAVFVEFSIFYPTLNIILISHLLVEFISTGGTVLSPTFQAFCLDPYSSPNAVPVIIAEVMCLLFLFYFIYKEINKLMKEKKRYFLSFWSWLEMLVIALLITALVTYLLRVNVQKNTIENYTAEPNKFANFNNLLFYDQLYSWMLYIVLFIANVKFLRLLRFNRRIAVFIDTMRYGWKYMMAFFCTFLLVFMAFASAAFIFFGSTILNFMNFMSTIEALLVVMLNVFSWDEFSESFFGPLFFIVYTLILNFILVNMFLSIVNDSFAVVKAESLEQQNQYELIDFMWNKFKKLFGFSNDVDNCSGQPVYAEEQDVVERDLNDCHDKIEEMCFRLQDYFTENHIEEQMKLDWRFKDVLKQSVDGHTKRPVVISE